MIPFYYLLLLVSLLNSCFATQLCHPKEAAALLEFKNSFSIDTSSYNLSKCYPKTNSWHDNLDCCLWDGITCHPTTGNIIGLDLSDSCLHGEFSSNNTLFSLRHLKSLNLAYNDFNASQISSNIGLFSSLTYLNLSQSAFTGPIPLSMSQLGDLVSVELDNNNLTGYFPEFQSPYLKTIRLRSNKLQGHIPNFIFKLVQLERLDLSSNNMTGPLAFHDFSNHKNLWYLNLSYSGLSIIDAHENINFKLPQLRYLSLSACRMEEFPKFLQALENLITLSLSYNFMYGPIPNWMYNVGIESLTYLSLSHNFMSGVVRFSWKNLSYFNIQSNFFRGPIPIPPGPITLPRIDLYSISNNSFTGMISSSICNSTYQVFDASRNNLSGVIPNCLVKTHDYYSVLNLQSNSFSGHIPSNFEKGCAFTYINVNENQLDGRLPRTIVNCRQLKVLDIGNNDIKDTFPFWLNTLPSLQILNLHANKFHSSIKTPKTKNVFPRLQILDISSNFFEGLLPIEYIRSFKAMMELTYNRSESLYMAQEKGMYYDYSVTVTMKGFEMELVKVLTILTTLDFSCNNFYGKIPDIIGKLRSLEGLNISHNFMTGSIPSAIGSLSSLEWLDLSSNNLSGKIPVELSDLTSLSVLNLSRNQLVGKIPSGRQFNTFGKSSFEGNLGLCGFPVSKSCGDESKQAPPQGGDNGKDAKDEHELEMFGWSSALIGYGSGTVFGILIGVGVFQTRKPEWFVKMIEDKQGMKRKQSRTNTHMEGRTKKTLAII